MKDLVIPPELVQAIQKDDLVIFVGAGLSYELKNRNSQKLGGWNDLVLNVLEHLKFKGHEKADILIPLVGQFEPIKILELIELSSELPKEEIISFTKDYFDLHEDENDYEIHTSLFQLSKKIITTNYDTSFETSNRQLRKHTAYKGKDFELAAHNLPGKPLLFKLHGCYENGDSMVLFPSGYEDLYNNPQRDAEHTLSVLRNIIYNKSVLFIGAGMGDFQINNLFKSIKELLGSYNQKHFIVTTKQLDSSLSFLTPLMISTHDHILPVIEKLLEVKEQFENEKPPEVLELEKKLAETEMRLNELENSKSVPSNSTERHQELLEREALKYFSKGVQFHLDEEYEKAIENYDLATELKPDLHEAYNNWGNSLSNIAKEKNDIKLFNQAFEKYEIATKIKPDKHEAFFNWGNDLVTLAELENDKNLLLQAIRKYATATEINPDMNEAFFNWGNQLAKLANSEKDEELLNQAFEKYEIAVEIKPTMYQAYNNWGTQLANLAKTKNDKELFIQSIEKYKKVIEIKPDTHEAFYNWGSNLTRLAQLKKGVQANSLYVEAIEKFEKSIDLDGNGYNLACLYALRSEKENAFKYLDLSLSKKEVTPDFVVEKDDDWKDYLEDDDFKALIEKYKKE